MVMNENNSWDAFENSGKIFDYLTYKGYGYTDKAKTSEVIINADKNTGDYIKTAQYRWKW